MLPIKNLHYKPVHFHDSIFWFCQNIQLWEMSVLWEIAVPWEIFVLWKIVESLEMFVLWKIDESWEMFVFRGISRALGN